MALALRIPLLAGFTFPRRLTLADLAAGAPIPTSLDDLAARIGVDPLLLHRVSQGRQPLPEQLVAPIARDLGSQPGEVRSAAGLVLSPRASRNARSLRPLPPDRLLGDALSQVPYRPTVPPAFA